MKCTLQLVPNGRAKKGLGGRRGEFSGSALAVAVEILEHVRQLRACVGLIRRNRGVSDLAIDRP